MAEAGYPEFTFGGFRPKDMPANLRERIAADAHAILKESDIQARLTNVGLIARGTTPSEFASVIDAQRTKWLQFWLHWEPHTIAMWDNRSTQHYAVNDYPQRRFMEGRP